jgi:hypothetical protein
MHGSEYAKSHCDYTRLTVVQIQPWSVVLEYDTVYSDWLVSRFGESAWLWYCVVL